MKLPNFRRIFLNDYPAEDRILVDRLAGTINIGFEVLYDALNKKANLIDNLASTVRDVVLTVNASGIPTVSTQFSLDLTSPVLGLQVIRAENLTSSTTYPTGGIFITYNQSGNNIIISHITGLPASNEFRIKVIAWHL